MREREEKSRTEHQLILVFLQDRARLSRHCLIKPDQKKITITSTGRRGGGQDDKEPSAICLFIRQAFVNKKHACLGGVCIK